MYWFFGGWVRYEHEPFINRWGAVARRHALAVQLDAGGPIAAFDLYKGLAKFALEIEHFPVIGPKLFFEIRPGDKSGFPRINTVQTLRQPRVNIETHCGVRQRAQIGFVEGYRVLF